MITSVLMHHGAMCGEILAAEKSTLFLMMRAVISFSVHRADVTFRRVLCSSACHHNDG